MLVSLPEGVRDRQRTTMITGSAPPGGAIRAGQAGAAALALRAVNR